MNRTVWILMHRKRSCLQDKKETERHFLEHIQVNFLILMLQSTVKLLKKEMLQLSIHKFMKLHGAQSKELETF